MAIKNPLNFFRKLNDFLNAQKQNQIKFDQFAKDLKIINSRLNDHLETYDNNMIKTDDFLDSYNSIEADLKNAVLNFNLKYNCTKENFFNGEEHLFKNVDIDRLFQMCFFNDIKLISYSPNENRILLKTKDDINLITNNRFYTIEEIFARNGYSTPNLHQFNEFVVFDIGMNRGYAALNFANFDTCKAVYGFEIDIDTYNFALENFNINPSLKHKIKTYNYGLSNENADVNIYCLPGSDGITTTELEFTDIHGNWKQGKERMKIKKANVKEAGHVIKDIIQKDKINSNIVLKIDTEGSEYKIIDNLISTDALDNVDLIMGEYHLESQNLDNKIPGFTDISKEHQNGPVYNFIYVRDKFYKPLPLFKP